MNDRERFIAYMNYRPVDRPPVYLVNPWPDTLERWYREGLTRGTDLNQFFGLSPLKIVNLSPDTGLHPWVPERIIQEDDKMKVFIDAYGRTVRDFKDHTSMPEWIDFPVKTPDDIKRILNERFNLDFLEERFTSDWACKVGRTRQDGALIMVDGGCYYWTLHSLAGVDGASYLFFDAPALVEDLFERINIVCLEGIRRVSRYARIDVIGFGEDIGFKTGPLISPAMFQRFILPRYRKVMDLAHSLGITLAWYDSDGDIREFIDDYLEAGINCLAPCEVAANMDPRDLRKQFGKDLRLIGGVDKRIVAHSKSAIDVEFERLKPLIAEGGYLPAIDHSVSSDISFGNYCYFVERLKKVLNV